ncbi:hypothetical protein DRF65_26825 [Chryseobacterium pennae]|uniref:T6SS Phospholipase effector Tle1-like catalytic domain-containing protein n=1 Tax=Chryseobacterium pennae TaxID=2258962 RepID=A0A3D9C0F5_9FLAO|nr:MULTISPECIES: DUF2235 domain-containing protein [Chryseobacterium]MCS4304602.1 hypothetical protein [Chryseobacterium sp. BIGb0232]REC59315.1 hypothetical protein DRF65_26825 [Chryseobacterium pennae]ROS20738.1 putative alpha/beta hydrolase family protein DUF2235 [Chryseobacterium nakagawai]
MVIIGDTRPLASKNYTYTISAATGNPKVKQWKVEYAGKVLATSTNGVFNFNPSMAGKTVKLTAVVDIHGKEMSYFINLQILAAMPAIEDLYWLDINNEKIGKRIVGYLDTVKLVIKTKNIPANDKIKVTIYEDEYADGHDEDSSRNMGTYEPYVDKKGYAYITFDNIKVYQKKLNSMDYVDESVHEFYAKVVYSNKVNQIKDTIQLQVKNELSKLVPPRVGSNPVVVGKVDSVAKTKKAPVNFTFGVFLDGTLNNMYNTEIRQKVTGIDVIKAEISGVTDDEAQKIYKKKGGAVDGKPSKGETSFENDLSNPAILFKNYKKSKNDKIFRVYTEGMGTNTAPKNYGDVLNTNDYKGDDMMMGPAFGMGPAGIMDRVRKSINDIKTEIVNNVVKGKEVVGTLTFDVFGFSRGAAAARHFVHVVTQGSYRARTKAWKEGFIVKDMFGYNISESYANGVMPAFGYLGQLLSEAGLMDEQTKIKIRFVGIYDTVPHHGLLQSNDSKDLGLNDVNRADYVVHMVAADEHRANFSLVDISSVAKVSPDSGKKGGIELHYPGVHCDVGGAYVEGWTDNPKRIDATIIKDSLYPLSQELIRQGWFLPEELTIKADPFYRLTVNNYRLEGERKLSNQYSFIPLHLMVSFCTKKSIPIKGEGVTDDYKFQENWISDNVKFLEGIKEKLKQYSFNGGKPLVFTEPEVYKEPPIVHATGDRKAVADWQQRQLEGQRRNDAEAEKKNKEIKFLRNHYLHWNATYGQSGSDLISQKNYPNIVDGKRKRTVY